MDNPFLKRLMKDKKEDVVHSYTYASAQNKGIGSASTITFSERQKINQNRSVIQGYSDAKLVRDSLSNGPKAKTYSEEIAEKPPTDTLKQRLDGASSGVTPAAEPGNSSRTYTPQIKPNIKPKF